MKYTKELIKNIENNEIVAYTLSNKNGFSVEILNLGGIITKIMVPDKDGNIENMVVGYKNIDSYITNPSYLGAIIGRTSGRICDAKFELDGQTYTLANNYGVNQGHGGDVAFDKKIWKSEVIEEENKISLKLTTISKHMEEGYPGNLDIVVTYTIDDNNNLNIKYEALTDTNTLVNMTNHTYFNLSGDLKSPVTEQNMIVDADCILELNKNCVPTGEKIDVTNTPFDFRNINNIGERIDNDHEQINIGQGYDHVWMLNKSKDSEIYMEDSVSGRYMEVSTDQPSVVIYSMNFPDNELLYNDKTYQRRYGICFETQNPPIGVNEVFKEYSILSKDKKYTQVTNFKFGVK